jgi:nucleoside-diphosphate-sugar epimerase
MIIGRGLIAGIFAQYDEDDLLIFASGVSNSLEVRAAEFEREKSLLINSLNSYPDKKIIYFSTCSICDPSKEESPYVLHKLAMEQLIEKHADRYIILRVGNVVGHGGNPNTLFNFLSNCIRNDLHFTLHSKAGRILIDAEHIPLFFDAVNSQNSKALISVSYPHQFSLYEIVGALEQFYSKKANFTSKEEGDRYDIEFSDEVISYFKDISPADYLQGLVQKYATPVH